MKSVTISYYLGKPCCSTKVELKLTYNDAAKDVEDKFKIDSFGVERENSASKVKCIVKAKPNDDLVFEEPIDNGANGSVALFSHNTLK